jgi:N-acetyl-anhydromuramyl-L-alanine amidase AmpD
MATTSFVDSILDAKLPETQYVDTAYPKSMIVLHHTASGPNPFGVQEYWISNAEKVGTQFIIAGKANTKKDWIDGGIYQCCESDKGIWHLGLKQKDMDRGKPGVIKTSTFCNMDSIGIELTCWGGLTEKGQAFISYAGVTVPEGQIQEYSGAFRGYHYYQRYTDAQIESTRKLLLYLTDKYDIPKKWIGMRMFNICPDMLRGVPAIYSHVSCRLDKQDCHPQPNFCEMLASL